MNDQPPTELAGTSSLAGQSRLDVIAELALAGHTGDPDLEAIIATVAEGCRAPFALLSLVTPGLQTYPAETGLGVASTEVPDALSFCAEVVRTGQPLIVLDARSHEVFADNPLVQAGSIRSYAGEPLVFGDQVIGALAIADSAARDFSAQELRVLRAQARVATSVLRLLAADRAAASGSTAQAAQTSQHLTAAELQHAIAEGQLVLHYHPVIDLRTDRMIGVEALVRWQHPTRGLLPPADFIELAEQSGLMTELGSWVLREGAGQAAAWDRTGQGLDVAINLSPLQMSDPGFAELAMAIVKDVKAPTHRIVLEVTESAVLDQSHAASMLQRLRAEGIRLALDDFGTGYCSFPYLRRFPIDIIKIDRSFVAGLGTHVDDEAIVASIVGLAQNTGKTVIAEGIEQEHHADLLRGLGAGFGQGFLWTQPLPAEQLLAWADAYHASGKVRAQAQATQLPAQPLPGSSRAVILGMHAHGASLNTIAAALNAQGRRTSGGVRWHARSVAQVVTWSAHVAQ